MARDDIRKVVKGDVSRHGEALGGTQIDDEYLALRHSRRWLVGVIVLLIALLAGLTLTLMYLTRPATVTEDEGKTGALSWVQSIYTAGNTGPDTDLLAPTSVAVAPNGEIYVAEPQRSRVLAYSSDGSFDRVIETPIVGGQPGSTEDTQAASNLLAESDEDLMAVGQRPMVRPESVSVDSKGVLYVADPARGAVFIFEDDKSQPSRILRLGEEAHGVAVTDDEIYVLGQGRVYVYKRSGGGAPLRWFGSFGSFPGDIHAYQGIEVSGGTVYIADSFNRRLEAFSTSGTFLWANPTTVSATDGSMNSTASADANTDKTTWGLPQDLTVDGTGRLIVVDALNFELSAVDKAKGDKIDSWGQYGTADGRFSYPSSVAYDKDRDRFVVADTKNNRVQIVTLPDSSKGIQNVARKIQTSPWRYILVPFFAVIVVLGLSFLVRKVYRFMRKRNDNKEID